MFKNMMLYRITNHDHVDQLGNYEVLEQALSGVPEEFPTGSQWRRLGFGQPVPLVNDNLVWSGPAGSHLITLYIHERDLKGTTIKEYVAARRAKIEEREQRKCYRKELAQIRDEVEAELLPKAFLKHSYVNMLIVGDLLVVESSTAKKAEDALDCLRRAMGSLGVRPIAYNKPMQEWLTMLMQDGKSGQFSCGSKVKLVNSVKSSVTFNDLDLEDEDQQNYLHQGFYASEMVMSFSDLCAFKLNDQLIFKGIKFSDMKVDTAHAEVNGDPGASTDANLMLFIDMVDRITKELHKLIGEDVPKKTGGEETQSIEFADLVETAEAYLKETGNVSADYIVTMNLVPRKMALLVIAHLQAHGQISTESDDRGYFPATGGVTATPTLTAAQRKQLIDDEDEEEDEFAQAAARLQPEEDDEL